MNAALRQHIFKSQQTVDEDTLRRVLREELHAID
jgi:hypothetical protein